MGYNVGMRPVRRHDYSPRVEMMPLIDVVFLLLTFFIYAMVVLVEFKSTGVALVSVDGGEQAAVDRVVVVEVDGEGRVLIDGRFVADDELDARFREIANRQQDTPIVLALQDVAASVDRGPILQRLWSRMSRAGIEDIQMPELNAGSGVSP